MCVGKGPEYGPPGQRRRHMGTPSLIMRGQQGTIVAHCRVTWIGVTDRKKTVKPRAPLDMGDESEWQPPAHILHARAP